MIKFKLEKDGSLLIEDYGCDLSVNTLKIEKQDVKKLRQLLVGKK
jgi:hypothetical protein